jgi:hypothetical protein
MVPVGCWGGGRMISILSRSRFVILMSATGVRVVRAGRLDNYCSGRGWGCCRRLLAPDLRQARGRQSECYEKLVGARVHMSKSLFSLLMPAGAWPFGFYWPEACMALGNEG